MSHLIGYLSIISFLLLGTFLKSDFEFTVTGLSIWAVFSALIAIPFYFESRESKAPSKFERTSASLWVIFRRIICFTGSIVCIVGLVVTTKHGQSNLAVQATLLLFSLMFIWVGVFGGGKSRGFQDDVYFHELRKKRYERNKPGPSINRDA